MLHKVAKGYPYEEPYVLLRSLYHVTSIKDTERNNNYNFNSDAEMRDFVGMLNMKEKIRTDFLKNIEKQLKQTEDRFIESYEWYMETYDELIETQKRVKYLEKKLEDNKVKF